MRGCSGVALVLDAALVAATGNMEEAVQAPVLQRKLSL